MVSWASKRRWAYIALVAAFFIIVLAYPAFSLFYKPPTCFDGKQNQDEVGIDCGGSCELLCAFETAEPIVLWSKSLEVSPGVYDAVAHIENPNVSAGIASVPYSFKLYDDRGVLIAERRGSTFINSKERLTIFEGGVETGRRTPERTFFEFTTAIQWVESEGSVAPLSVKNQVFVSGEGRPRLRAELVNDSLEAVDNILITALIFDKNNNVIAASKTEVDRIVPQSSKPISFIWPQTFVDEAIRIEIVPRVNLINL